MADNMKILISAALDLNRAEKDINRSIEQLSKHPSLQKLKLNITINDDFIKNLSSFSKNLNLITSQINQQSSANNTLNNGLNSTTKSINEQIKVTNEAIAAEKKWQIEREKTNSKGIKTTTYGSTETNAKQVVTTLPDGSIKNIDNIQNQIKDAKELQSLINKMAEGRIASESRVRDFQRQWNQNQLNEITKNSKTELALAEQMAQGRIAAESKTRDFERQWNESQQRSIQNNADLERVEITRTQQTRKAYEDWYLKAIRERETQDAKTYTNLNSKLSTSKTTAVTGVENAKALDLLNRKYDEVAQRIAMIQASGRQLTDSELNGINRRIKALNDLASRQMKAEQELISIQTKAEQKVASLSSAYSKIDNTKLNLLLAQLKNLTTSTDNYKTKAAQLVSEIRQIGDEARATSGHTRTFGDSLKSAMSNILLYSGVGSVFFGITSALKEMTRTIIDVDSQMTQLKRVMDEDTDFDSMLGKSIELANELGRSIKEVNENAIGFARMGFDESQTIALAKTATLFQNISDLTPDEAVDTLTSAMTVFNVEAGKSIEVANKINEVKFLPPYTVMYIEKPFLIDLEAVTYKGDGDRAQAQAA